MDFVLYDRVKALENLVDKHERSLYHMQQKMNDLQEQVKWFKERMSNDEK